MKNKKILYTIISLLVFSGVLLTFGITSYLIKKPLAPPLTIDTSPVLTPTSGLEFPVPLPTGLTINVPTATSRAVNEDIIPTQTPFSITVFPSTSPSTAEKTPAALEKHENPFELCDVQSAQIILLIAMNHEDENRIHPLNFIRFVHIEPSEKRISVYSLSQKDILSGQILDRLPLSTSQLGDVYNYVINNSSGSSKDLVYVASNYLAQGIFDVYGLVPDHFITFDPSSVLSVYMETETILLADSDENLGSEEIIQYLLSSPDNNQNPISSQNTILLSLLENLQQKDHKFNPEFINELSGETLITDFAPSEINQFFCLLENLDQEMIFFYTLSE